MSKRSELDDLSLRSTIALHFFLKDDRVISKTLIRSGDVARLAQVLVEGLHPVAKAIARANDKHVEVSDILKVALSYAEWFEKHLDDLEGGEDDE